MSTSLCLSYYIVPSNTTAEENLKCVAHQSFTRINYIIQPSGQ